MRGFLQRVVWAAVLAAVLALAAVGVAIVYGESQRIVVLALVGGGVTFSILALAPRT